MNVILTLETLALPPGGVKGLTMNMNCDVTCGQVWYTGA